MTGIGADPNLAVSIIEIKPDGNSREELHCNIESLLTPTYVWTKDGVVYVKIKIIVHNYMKLFVAGCQLRGQKMEYLLLKGLI